MANKTLSYDGIAGELMTKASRSRAKKRANAIVELMTLDELRKDGKMIQGKVAHATKTEQSEVPVWKTRPKSNRGSC